MPGHINNFYLANGTKLSEVLILHHKMETRIWNKTRIWNTFADDQVVFQIRVYSVYFFISILVAAMGLLDLVLEKPVLIVQLQLLPHR